MLGVTSNDCWHFALQAVEFGEHVARKQGSEHHGKSSGKGSMTGPAAPRALAALPETVVACKVSRG